MEEDLKYVFKEMFPPKNIFSSIKNKKSLEKVLVDEFNMVKAKKLSISSGLEWKKRIVKSKVLWRLVNVSDDAYVVPFIDNLKNFLSNECVIHQVLNPPCKKCEY